MTLLKEKLLIKDGFKVLYFAPEGYFPKNIKKLFNNLDYTTCDINPEKYQGHNAIQIDITNIALPDSQFDIII